MPHVWTIEVLACQHSFPQPAKDSHDTGFDAMLPTQPVSGHCGGALTGCGETKLARETDGMSEGRSGSSGLFGLSGLSGSTK